MDAIGAIKLAFAGSHQWYQGTIGDVSSDAANRVPDGVAHPIGAIAAHIIQCEDVMINTAIQGRQSIWERDGWGAKLGLPLLVDPELEKARSCKCDPQQLREYAETVYKNTDAYLSALQPEDLDKEVDLTEAGMGKMGVAEFLLTALLGNNYAHTGEISALKGIMGKRGYPF